MPSCPWDSCVDHSRRPGLCEFPCCSSAPEPPPGRGVGLSGTTIVKDGYLSHVLRWSAGHGDRVGATSADSCSSPCRWSGGGAKHAERLSWRPLREIVLSLAPHCGSAELAVRHDLTARPPIRWRGGGEVTVAGCFTGGAGPGRNCLDGRRPRPCSRRSRVAPPWYVPGWRGRAAAGRPGFGGG